jgi:hypothetical protein
MILRIQGTKIVGLGNTRYLDSILELHPTLLYLLSLVGEVDLPELWLPAG